MKITKPTAIALDLVAIAAFALFARMAHQSDDMPLNLAGWASTVWPFALGVVLGWVIVLAGSRKDGDRGVLVWLVTVITGLVIWGIRNQALPHWSFVIVASVMSALLMLGWRGLAKLFGKKTAV